MDKYVYVRMCCADILKTDMRDIYGQYSRQEFEGLSLAFLRLVLNPPKREEDEEEKNCGHVKSAGAKFNPIL